MKFYETQKEREDMEIIAIATAIAIICGLVKLVRKEQQEEKRLKEILANPPHLRVSHRKE